MESLTTKDIDLIELHMLFSEVIYEEEVYDDKLDKDIGSLSARHLWIWHRVYDCSP